MSDLYERRDLSPKAVALFMVGICAVLVLVLFVAGPVDRWFEHRQRASYPLDHPLSTPAEPPPPHLQVNPTRDLAARKEAERKLLSSYGWVDHDKGKVRIPIERAMERVVEEGLGSK